MTYATLADYYAAQDILPTDARLQTQEDVERYVEARRIFLNDKLYLPARLFNGAELIEFGPDSGENALAFATWGAKCDLIEPNVNAWSRITEYIAKCTPPHFPRIDGASGEGITEYAKREIKKRYDFAIAEGFIYTVQPSSIWIDLFARLLHPRGFALISYYERYGGWIELFTKLIYNRVKTLTDWQSIDAARTLFSPKWMTISHTRTLEQWHMDVLENPFVRLHYFLDANDLCQGMEAANMRLYSSWPQYRNGLTVRWHKSPMVSNDRAEFLQRQQLGYLLGTAAFMRFPRELGAVVTATDALIDKWDDENFGLLAAGLKTLWGAAQNCIAYGDGRLVRARIDSLTACAEYLRAGDVDAIVSYCRTDPLWLGLWGQPNHFAVFQKE